MIYEICGPFRYIKSLEQICPGMLMCFICLLVNKWPRNGLYRLFRKTNFINCTHHLNIFFLIFCNRDKVANQNILKYFLLHNKIRVDGQTIYNFLIVKIFSIYSMLIHKNTRIYISNNRKNCIKIRW